MAIKIFVCYAHEDELLLNKIRTHLIPLQKQGIIDVWHDRDINAGREWEYEISKYLNEAQIILLLVSPDFMASDYISEVELKRAMKRHEQGEARVIPIIVRPVHWGDKLGKLQALPKEAKPIITWDNMDEALLNVTEGIIKVVEEISKHPLSGTSKEVKEISTIQPVQHHISKPYQFPNFKQIEMSNEQQRILQILYEKRSDSPYTFDREDLAKRMGNPWPKIKNEVADLERDEYLVTEHSSMGARNFHRPKITAKGVEFVKKGRDSPGLLKEIKVFISSPGDVYEERGIVKRVLERCNRIQSIAHHYVLRPLAYEENAPAEVGSRPQAIVDRHMMLASNSDLLICIFCHRMGTPVTHEKTGERFQSGTEYEFLDAYRHNQKDGKPYILLYRGMKPLPADVDQEQLRAVQAFFKQFEGEQAALKGLYKVYRSNEEFEDILFYDIDKVLSKNSIL